MRALAAIAGVAAFAAPVADGATVVPDRATPSIVQADVDGNAAYPLSETTVRFVRADGTTMDRPAPPSCILIAVRDSTMLWSCPTSDRLVPVLQDAGTGVLSQPPSVQTSGFTDADLDGQITGLGLGRTWLLASQYGSHWERYVLLARTGTPTTPSAPRSARQVMDLDRPSGVRALCAPLRRDPTDPAVAAEGDASQWDPFTYERPWGLTTTSAVGVPRLWRCGQRTPTVVRCGACVGLRLFAGRLWWIDGRRLVVRDLRRGTTRRRVLPAGVDQDRAFLTPTPTAVYIAVGKRLYRMDAAT